jgi:hypothetical protein
MRRDTTTTPTRASTIASSPSAGIDALKGKLHCRYAERAGQFELGQDWGWRTPCGRSSVFPLGGKDTCRACIAELTANRTGRQP